MRTLERELESPVYALARKSQAALELYLGERVSTVSFLAHAYTFKDLLDERTLNRVFLALKSEYQGFVDMGLVDADGQQVGYVGPYKLKGVDYAGKPWLRDTEIKGRYLSNAILGYRGYPHLVVAVHRLEENGVSCVCLLWMTNLPFRSLWPSVWHCAATKPQPRRMPMQPWPNWRAALETSYFLMWGCRVWTAWIC